MLLTVGPDIGLIVGLSVAGAGVVLIIIGGSIAGGALGVRWWKKKKR